MRVLIALNELEHFFGGIQTWSMTMRGALEKLGHMVEFFTLSLGRFPSRPFDLILCSTNTTLNSIRRLKGRKVFISHGVLPRLEQPVKGADVYIAVSEEVAKNCKSKGFPVHRIIRNPIDCDRFCFSGCRKTLRTIVFFDRRRKFKFIKEVKESGFEVIEIGKPPVPKPEEYLKKADLVVARGRGAYEAMAMGKNVIVSGNNSGRSDVELMDGFVDERTFFQFRQNNLSGRYNCIQVSLVELFLREIKKYNQERGILNRGLVLTHNDSRKIAKQFLELAR